MWPGYEIGELPFDDIVRISRLRQVDCNEFSNEIMKREILRPERDLGFARFSYYLGPTYLERRITQSLTTEPLLVFTCTVDLTFNFSNDKQQQQQYIEIALQTVNKPLADCYALGGPPTVSIASGLAVLTAKPAAKAPNQLFRA